MNENQTSLTALISAYVRAYHSMYESPKIFDDFFASKLFTEEELEFFGRSMADILKFFDPESAAQCPDQKSALAKVMRVQSGPITLSRVQYTEEVLENEVNQGVRQYVILGAGFDTFAFRRPDLLEKLQVFEIDHPATQIEKKKRIQRLGVNIPEQLHFISVDFSKDNLAEKLKDSAFDPRKKSFVSWLGVTYYLGAESVLATLSSVGKTIPTGSSIVFDYMDAEAFIPEKVSRRIQLLMQVVKNTGEPMKTGLDPSALKETLYGAGFNLKENLSPNDIQDRFFKGQTDGYHAYEYVHFALASVL